MASILQLRRGSSGTRLGFAPAAGELFEDTDVTRPFIGDGSVLGGRMIGAPKIQVSAATTFSILFTDVGKLLVFTGAGCAVALGQAGSSAGLYFPDQTGIGILNLGSGAVVITPTTSTINGAASLSVPIGGFAEIYSNGTNYYADASAGPAGTGTVTSVATGTGLTGGPITGSGTILFADIADDRLLANISGGSAAPSANTLTAVIDAMIGGNNGDMLYRTGGVWTNQRPKYVIASSMDGVLTASQNLLHHRFTRAVTFPANFGAYLGNNSEAGGTTNATGSTVINVDLAPTATPNTFSNIGTITIGAGSVTPTFATSGGSAQNAAQGDVLRIVGPSSADATFAGFYMSLVGFDT